VTLAISIILALLIARSIAGPLQRITAATEEIAHGNYDQTLDITSPDEIGRLAASFNAMVREVKASIQGFSQAILDGTADDELNRRRAVEIICNEANRMARLVDELLDLARIESGQIKMIRKPVNLAKVLRACVEKFTPQAEKNNILLELDIPDLPLITGDEDRLAQVFTNLLDNALKHTPPEGRVIIKAQELKQKPREKTRPTPMVEITVTDTGSGIPPEDLKYIFERFYQVNKSRAGKNRGVGLGLTIAKQIVEAHEGKISVESVLDLGTKFTINLPIENMDN
jgi:two-component system sensor histidine kinase ResE